MAQSVDHDIEVVTWINEHHHFRANLLYTSSWLRKEMNAILVGMYKNKGIHNSKR